MATMKPGRPTKSAAIRARLSHPVIDTDGHGTEYGPLVLDYLKAVAGQQVADRFRSAFSDTNLDPNWKTFSQEERRARRGLRPTYRAAPAKNTLDLATTLLPGLMYERLDEMGLDFTVLYPGLGLVVGNINDEEVRRGCARAINNMRADLYGEFSNRMSPAAVIPMHTPQEAIDELEHSVKGLGLKVVMLASYVRRPISMIADKYPEAAHHACWLDTFGLDSEYDYDPVWAKCVELKVFPTFHSVGYGWGSRSSISNYLHNHLGNFAASAEAVCRGILLGGVPQRFPNLPFAFMEGGVAWARALYCDLIGHWDKRNPVAIQDLDPAKIDSALLSDLVKRHGAKLANGHPEEVAQSCLPILSVAEDPAMIDEWAQSGITGPADIAHIFSQRFFFGCEGDDPLNASAFDTRGISGAIKLPILFGSDIGHWDVPDMRMVTEEAYELVEQGLVTEDDFKDFVYTNPMKLFTSMNKDFFQGTVLEDQAKSFLAAERKAPHHTVSSAHPPNT